MPVRVKYSRRADQFSVERKQLLDDLGRRGLRAMFELARVLPPSLLRRAIKLVRSVKNYPRRDQLLEVLKAYLARRSKYPATLDREIRASRSKLRGPERTLPQMLVPLSPDERFAVLEKTISSLEKRKAKRKIRSPSTSGKRFAKRGTLAGGPLEPGLPKARSRVRGSGHKDRERSREGG